MTVYVRYQVPVLAEVDLQAGRVARVVVDDEAIGEAGEVFAVGESALSASEEERALEVANTERSFRASSRRRMSLQRRVSLTTGMGRVVLAW